MADDREEKIIKLIQEYLTTAPGEIVIQDQNILFKAIRDIFDPQVTKDGYPVWTWFKNPEVKGKEKQVFRNSDLVRNLKPGQIFRIISNLKDDDSYTDI